MLAVLSEGEKGEEENIDNDDHRGVQTIRRPFDYEAFRLLFRQSPLKLFLNTSDCMKFDIFYQIKNIKLHIVTDIKEKFKR